MSGGKKVTFRYIPYISRNISLEYSRNINLNFLMINPQTVLSCLQDLAIFKETLFTWH
jgi:hypothetical protein